MAYPFVVRRATMADKEAVVALCNAIDPHDWVPANYAYLIDNSGKDGLFVAEQEDGGIVGCYYLQFPAETEAYFSAMRINPLSQGRGLGSLFCRVQVEQARAAGAGDIYLLSVLENSPAHRTVLKNNFTNVGEWLIYDDRPSLFGSAGPVAGQAITVRPGTVADLPAVAAFVAQWQRQPVHHVIATPYLAWAVRGMGTGDWRPEHLVLVPGPAGPLGVMLLHVSKEEGLIRYLEGTPEAAAHLLAYAAAEGARRGATTWSISLPATAEPLLSPLGLDPALAFRAYVFCLRAGTELPVVTA